MTMLRKITIACGLAFAMSGTALYAQDSGVTKTEVLIGAFLPLQSGLAGGAAQVRDGALAYVQHINENGGVNGRKLRWLFENDSYNPQQAVAVTKKLVERDGIFAIVSPLGTATGLAVLPYVAQKKIPMLGPVAGSPRLLEPKEREVFGVLPSGIRRGQAVAKHAVEGMAGKKIAVFFQNDDFGKDLRDGVKEQLKAAGQSIVGEALYEPNDIDMSSQVAKLRAADPDVVVLAGIPKPVSLFVNEAAKQGWQPKYVGSSPISDPLMAELAAKNADDINIVFDVALPNMPESAKANEILAKYTSQTRPGYFVYNGMIGMMLFVEALKRSGPEPTRAAIIAELEKLKDFHSDIFPPISYSADNHAGVSSYGLAKWKNGKLEVLKSWK